MQHYDAPQPVAAGGNRWSLGDLLARASVESDTRTPSSLPAPAPAAEPTQHPSAPINLEAIASAIDSDTAAAIWARYRSGQRGIMVRSIYSNEGRATFDEVVRRYGSEANIRGTVDKFLADFERLLQESDARDPSGRAAEGHLASASGRTYLFLAHAAGRLQ